MSPRAESGPNAGLEIARRPRRDGGRMPTPTRIRLLLACAAAGMALAASGCATQAAVRVRPWDRGLLADATMDRNRDPIATSAAEHVYFSREAAQGGLGVGGAGCGCN